MWSRARFTAKYAEKQLSKEDTMVQYSWEDLRSNAIGEKDHTCLKEAATQSEMSESKVRQRIRCQDSENAVTWKN